MYQNIKTGLQYLAAASCRFSGWWRWSSACHNKLVYVRTCGIHRDRCQGRLFMFTRCQVPRGLGLCSCKWLILLYCVIVHGSFAVIIDICLGYDSRFLLVAAQPGYWKCNFFRTVWFRGTVRLHSGRLWLHSRCRLRLRRRQTSATAG